MNFNMNNIFKKLNQQKLNQQKLNQQKLNQQTYELEKFTNKFTNKKLKKIVNVYQLNCVNDKTPGLGDFIRGSFCFMQLAQLLNLEFEIDISNHPISCYLENSSSVIGVDYKNITFYKEGNHDQAISNNYNPKDNNIQENFLNKTIQWLNSQDCETFGFFSNAWPSFHRYTEKGKNVLNFKFQPNKLMRTYINNTLSELMLTKKMYSVIHIRTGDNYLLSNKQTSEKFINKIKYAIDSFIDPKCTYLILSDSNYLKNELKIYPNFCISIRNIEHLGGESINKTNTEGIKNTLLDYYLMSHSNEIICLSVYHHISGFSKYCSVLNNIPFKSFNNILSNTD